MTQASLYLASQYGGLCYGVRNPENFSFNIGEILALSDTVIVNCNLSASIFELINILDVCVHSIFKPHDVFESHDAREQLVDLEKRNAESPAKEIAAAKAENRNAASIDDRSVASKENRIFK